MGLPGRLSSNWPLYVAADRGFFAQEGLNVELIALRNATIQMQALVAGDLQFKKGDYVILSMGLDSDRANALKAGRVHGTLLIQPTDFGLLDEGFRSVGFVGDFLKDCEYVGYIVNDEWAKDNGATVVSFMRAVLRSLDWLHNPARSTIAY